MEWMVYIAGDDLDLSELSKSLISPELCIVKEENQYYLKSTSFNQLVNVDQVREKAEEILPLINGASRLVLGTRKPIKINSVANVDVDGKKKRTYFELGLESLIHCTASVVVNGVEQVVYPAEPIPDWIKVAQTDESVAKVFRLLNKEDYDWVNLYRIYEVVEDDIGATSKIVQQGWASEKEIERFKHTANSIGAIGDFARHGKEKTKPPKDPMKFSEAKSLIETMLHNWLRSKIQKS